jgi:type III secretion protein L
MLRLEKSGIEILPSAQVLKAEEYAAVVDATKLLEAAREEAKLIREEALQEFEKQKKAGYKEGLEIGKAEVSEKMLDCVTQSAVYFSKLEDVLIDLVMRILRKVIGEFDHKDLVESVVKRALESTRNETQVTVRVSPTQAEELQSKVESLTSAYPKIQVLSIQPDSRIPEGGCVLETEMGVVDASLETQFKAIEKSFIKSMK